MEKISVIITAGGIGKRMETELPKQFLVINELPILMHTISAIHRFDPSAEIILSLPKEWISYWQNELKKYTFSIPHQIVEGGKERFHSVKNALAFCSNNFIAIHDAVRPMVSTSTLENLWLQVRAGENVVPVIDIKEAVRKVISESSEAIDRTTLKLVQTPQCFPKEIICKAYEQEYDSLFTDDASVVEKTGQRIKMTQGNQENIKITFPMDLLFAAAYLKLKEQ
ncbi:MAG: 2-C-methyl-D-erythritol 4-phosphate cytidylyltransferase [Bacteroidota bacterium]